VTLLSFSTTITGDVAVISLEGELDVAGAALLEQEIERVTADHGPTKLVLDLSGLEFMDSTGLRLVVLADARAREQGRRFAVIRGPESVHRVFEITRMSERLEFVAPGTDLSAEPPGGTAA
jgi:anti-sigma B factor antagonist